MYEFVDFVPAYSTSNLFPLTLYLGHKTPATNTSWGNAYGIIRPFTADYRRRYRAARSVNFVDYRDLGI